MRIRLALSPAADIADAAKKYYGVGADTLDQMMHDDYVDLSADMTLMKDDISELDSEASIVKFVNQVIWEAYQERATDIHLEPMENELRIRYRVDGRLHATPLPPQLIRFQAAIISRIKVMANMDIAEKRLPQDGRIGLRLQGEEIDIRVSTMPTVYGESVSLRLLMRGGELISLTDLGLAPRDKEIIDKMIHRPNGIVLVTGPTGSGKSTSLYAYLHEINSIDQRIITVEDPIEYEMAGINQIAVRSDIGLTFATALRHILRQDPDVVMIGEIRDFETAEIAIRASLTGHLVFSTLHTNDAAGAVTRLLDMGVEPFLVASSVKAIVAQRLVRRLCKDCRQPLTMDETFLRSVDFPVERLAADQAYEAVGCEACRDTGYRGRMGIYEVLPITEQIEPLIVARTSASEIKKVGLNQGMKTLRDDGWDKVLRGMTTVDEVLRVSEDIEGEEE
jgi:type II secretory ATPase GspE/PulE/Tfp pilus assembly ATPase PilB-like protein